MISIFSEQIEYIENNKQYGIKVDWNLIYKDYIKIT